MDTDLRTDLLAAASRSHGVITRRRLLALGARGSTLDDDRAGRLCELLPGVYRAAGAPATAHGRVLAAVLGVGDDALASYVTALRLWGLWPLTTDGDVDVMVDERAQVDPSGVRLHHTRLLHPTERTELLAIPVTTVARTLCDVARYVTPLTVRDLLADGVSRGLVTPADVARSVELRRRFPGRSSVRDALARFTEAQGRYFSKLERRSRNSVVGDGLPAPQVNLPIVGASGHSYLGDQVWFEVLYDAEVDGPHHLQPSQQRRDQRRDADLCAAGWAVDRFTEDEIRAGEHLPVIRARLIERGHPALR